MGEIEGLSAKTSHSVEEGLSIQVVDIVSVFLLLPLNILWWTLVSPEALRSGPSCGCFHSCRCRRRNRQVRVFGMWIYTSDVILSYFVYILFHDHNSLAII